MYDASWHMYSFISFHAFHSQIIDCRCRCLYVGVVSQILETYDDPSMISLCLSGKRSYEL